MVTIQRILLQKHKKQLDRVLVLFFPKQGYRLIPKVIWETDEINLTEESIQIL